MENHPSPSFFCAVLPHDPWQTLQPTPLPFWLCYQAGSGPRLYRCAPQSQISGGVLCAHDGSLDQCGDPAFFCRQVVRECQAVHALGFCANWSRPPVPPIRQLTYTLGNALASRGLTLFVTEPYGEVCQRAKVLISCGSAVSIRERLKNACELYGPERVVMVYEQICEDHTLPTKQLHGTRLSPQRLEGLVERFSPQIHNADALFLRYFTYEWENQTHFVVFDDESTLRQKLDLAQELGLFGVLSAFQEIGGIRHETNR